MKLFIGGLAWSTTDASLRSAFEKFGAVNEAIVVLDRETGRSRGFGFVTFASREDGVRAQQEMSGAPVDGRSIRIDEAVERPNRGRGGPPPRGDDRGPPPRRFDDGRGDDRGPPPRRFDDGRGDDRGPPPRRFDGPPGRPDDRGPPRDVGPRPPVDAGRRFEGVRGPDLGRPRGFDGPRVDEGRRFDSGPRPSAPGFDPAVARPSPEGVRAEPRRKKPKVVRERRSQEGPDDRARGPRKRGGGQRQEIFENVEDYDEDDS